MDETAIILLIFIKIAYNDIYTMAYRNKQPNLKSADNAYLPDFRQISKFNDLQYSRAYGMYVCIFIYVCNSASSVMLNNNTMS